MNLEQKIKNSLVLLISLFFILFAWGFLNSEAVMFYCLLAALFFSASFLLFQAYIRIQHNIDKRSDYLLDIGKKTAESHSFEEKNIKEYIDNFKRDTLLFFEKLLDKLESDKQKTDKDFLSEKADLDRKMEIAFDKLDFFRKEMNYKMEKMAEKNNDIFVALKVLEKRLEMIEDKEKDKAR